MSDPPKPAGGPVTRARAKFQGGQPWTAITTTRAPITPLGPSESLDSDDVRNDDGDVVIDAPNRWIAVVEHQSLAHTNWHKAITSRDIDALVQLKLLTKAL